MEYQTRPLHTLSMNEAADLFNRSFEGYFVPVQFTESAFRLFVERDDIDLDASQVLLAERQPIGLALIARRRAASRIGGFGIVSKFRGRGSGSWFVKRLLEDARQRGEAHVFLEVITQNEAAVRLYEKHGFVKLKKLLGFKAEKPTGKADSDLQAYEKGPIVEVLRSQPLSDWPWQLDAETLSRTEAFGYRLREAFALISDPRTEHISIRTLLALNREHEQEYASHLLEALFAGYPDKTWHVPAIFPEEMGPIFARAGMQEETLSQWLMVCRL